MTDSLVGVVCSECGNGTYAVDTVQFQGWVATCTRCHTDWLLMVNGEIKAMERCGDGEARG